MSHCNIIHKDVLKDNKRQLSMLSHYDWLGFHPIRDLRVTTNLTLLSFFDHTYSLSWNITFFFIYDFFLCNTFIVVNFINFFALLQYPIKTNNLLGSDVQKQSVDNFCQSYFNLYRINNVLFVGCEKKSISSVILFPTCLRWQHSFQCQIISWTDAKYLNW